MRGGRGVGGWKGDMGSYRGGEGQRGKRAGQEVMRWRVAVPVFT
jgi:hypothetical protein